MAEEFKPSYSFTDDRLNELIQLFPEAFEDGKFNVDTLKELIGDYSSDNSASEHFGLNWVGKKDARKVAAKAPTGTLKPVLSEGVNEESTQNIFIEGDNLEVLKIIKKSYAGKIKMIYIDPPYNTGNDFIYKDNFADSTEDYLRKSGEKSEEGLLVSNPKTTGRFHGSWLSFMYSRLRLAKEMLHEEGFIFISIDDNEVHNLIAMMNEIFGEENFLGSFIWKKKAGGGDDSGQIAIEHEYIICYSKSREKIKLGKIQHESPSMTAKYNREENGRRYYLERLDKTSLTYSASMDYPIECPDGTEILPPQPNPNNRTTIWRWSKEKVDSSKNEIEFHKDKKTGEWRIYTRTWESLDGVTPRSLLTESKHGRNRDGSQELAKLLGPKIFNNPKPQRLLRHLLEVADLNEGDIILDFFSGSSSIAHALLDANNEEGITRKFILVQLPELCDEKSGAFAEGYKTIAEISKERIRRVIKKINDENPESSADFGFKVFKQSSSSIYKWQDFDPEKGEGIAAFKTQMELAFKNPVQDGTSVDDFVTEILLNEGFPLTSSKEDIGNGIYKVSHEWVPYALFVTMTDALSKEHIEALEIDEKDHFVCLDKAFQQDNSLKQTLDNQCKLFTI